MARRLLMAAIGVALAAPCGAAGTVVLYSNGPIVNLPGGGPGGAHLSRVQGELGLTELGFYLVMGTPSSLTSVELADDFVIDTPGGWHVNAVRLYTLPAAFFASTSCIGPEVNYARLTVAAAPGGPSFAGGLVSPTPTGIYRVPSGDPTVTSCPIKATTIPVNLNLGPGTYWVTWLLDGSSGSFLGFSPLAVPVTRQGQAATGNAQARITACDIINPLCPPGPWFPLLDGGAQQGLAFEVLGTTQSRVKGNLDGQRSADLLLRNVNPASPDYGRIKAWLMNGTTRVSETFVSPDPPGPNWVLVGSDDFDSWSAPGRGPDGQTDLVFYDETTGQVEFWLLDGTTRAGAPVPLTGAAPPPLDWRPVATGDFDEDGRPDLIWRSTSTRKLSIWRMNGTVMAGGLAPSPNEAANANWAIVAALDYNGDGHRDLLWYNATSGSAVTWYLNASAQRLSGQFVNPPSAGNANWKVVAGGDYSWNQVPGTPPLQSSDIVWRNETSGRLVVWHMDNASTRLFGEFTNPSSEPAALDWTVIGPR